MGDAKARVGAIVDIINEERSRLPDTPVHTSAEVHLKIAHVIIKVFVEVVSACAKLSLKFGAPLVIDILAEIDTVFSGYLSALTGCAPGLGQVLNNLAGNINGDIVSDLRIVGLTQCVTLLDLVGKFPGVAK